MILHIVCLWAIATVQIVFGTSEGARKYRSLGRVDYGENFFRCPTEGFHPDTRDCRIFYRCVDWASNDYFRDYTEPQLTAFRFECGEGTVFDPDFNVCNYPRNTRRAECGGYRPDGSNNESYTPLTESHNSQNGQNEYPDQGGFSKEHENHIIPINEEGTNKEPLAPSENCQSPGFHPVKGNCQKFIRCVNNGKGGFTKYEFSCGPGTVWDPVNTVCNYPSQVSGCGGSDKTENLGQGISPGQGEYPGPGGTPGQGGYPGPGGTPGQGGYPGSGGMPGQGGYPGLGGMPGQGGRPGQGGGGSGGGGQGGYPGPGGMPGQGGRPGQGGGGGGGGQGGYPGPGGMPGQGGRPGQGGGGGGGQGGYPGSGGMPGQGGYPGSGETPGQGGYPGPGGTPGQGGYPGPGGTPGQGGYPGPGGTPGQGGYPGSGGMPGQGGKPGQGGGGSGGGQGGYPGSGGMPGQGGRPGQGGGGGGGQGGYPGSGGMPGQGEYPELGGTPGQENNEKPEGNIQGGMFSGTCTSPGFYGVPGNCKKFIRCVENGMGGFNRYDFECGAGTAWDIKFNTCNHAYAVEGCGNSSHISTDENAPETSRPGERPGQGRPEPEGTPEQGGYPGPGGMPGQGGYPRPGGMPGQGGYPRPGGMPGQGGYPGPGEMSGQGGYPGPGVMPGQEGMPGQGGYPGSGGMPGQGGYPGSGGMPGQGGYPGPGGMPGQGGYPGPGGMPGQGGYPGPGGMPGQGGYPENKPTDSPGPDSLSNFEIKDPSSGDASECQSDGFYPVKNSCKTFFRCVNNGKNGYLRYDFQCGDGTIWDQENQVCNYPWAVARQDIHCDMSSTSQSSTQTTSSSSSMFSQSTSYFNSSSSSQNQFSTSSSTTQSGTSQSQSQTGATSSFQTQSQGLQTSSNQTSNQEWNQFSSKKPIEQSSTKPMSPQPSPTTENPEPETTSPGEDPSKPPSGSSPCDRNKMPGQIKCEKAGFYPDPIDCSKFYRCVDWGDKKFSVYYFECGKGTIWDPALETCNYEKSVYPPRDCSSSGTESTQKPSIEQSTSSPATEEPNNALTTEKQTSSSPINATITKQPTTVTPTTINTISDNLTSTDLPVSETQTTTRIPSSQTSSTSATDMTTSSYQTDITTSSTNSSPEAMESTTLMVTSVPSSTDSTESSTKTDESSEMTTESTTTSPTEESTDSSTASQMETTAPSSNSESTELTESTTSQMITTEASSGKDPNCPQLNDDQSAFVCPTGFRRHPKDCNLFYQCTTSKDTGDINIMILSCKNDTVYDERKIQCLPPEETDSCQNQVQGKRVYRRAEDEFSSVVYVSPFKKLCPEEGSFAYEGDCTRFYKCKKGKRGKIQGYLYQCPDNYSFYDITGRCEKSSKIPPCTRSIPEVTVKTIKWMKSKVPVEYSSSAFR